MTNKMEGNTNAEELTECFVRANSRANAKAAVRQILPAAVFFC